MDTRGAGVRDFKLKQLPTSNVLYVGISFTVVKLDINLYSSFVKSSDDLPKHGTLKNSFSSFTFSKSFNRGALIFKNFSTDLSIIQF